MIATLLLAALVGQGSVRTVDLARGAFVQPSDPSLPPFQYFGVSDTYIDATAPDDNFAGEPTVMGSLSKVILIRFGDLNRVLGGTRHIRKATLSLTIAGGDKPLLKSADLLKTSWNAGPYFTINALITRNIESAEQKKGEPPKEGPPRWSVTWKHRFAGDGGEPWQGAGANGPQDSDPIRGATATSNDKTTTIEGLGPAFQQMADNPTKNCGIALRFQNACEFFSTRAAIGQPKLELELDASPPTSGPDLSVSSIVRSFKAGGQGTEGEDATYTAHVANVGAEASGGFSAVWTVDGRAGAEMEVKDGIAPGAETVLESHAAYRIDRSDHRVHRVSLRIVPKGPDATQGNDSLEIFPNGKQIDVIVPTSLANSKELNLTGSRSISDWIQAQFRIFNETFAAESRFSFAPDGVKERVSVHRILIGADQASTDRDGVVTLPEAERDWLGSDPQFLQAIGFAAGIPDYRLMSVASGPRVGLKDSGNPVNSGSADLNPGLMGYGDTRYEGMMAGPATVEYEPYAPESPGTIPLVPTDLLCATGVEALNEPMDRRAAFPTLPKTTVIRTVDLGGRPISDAQLSFYQTKGGKVLDGAPVFSVTSSHLEGSALLPNIGGLGPFGKLDADGGNGAFLIKAVANGVTAWSWLKAWELIDTASRGNIAVGLMEVRFNLPSGVLDSSTDLAQDRIISDSTNQLPAKLATLVGAGNVDVALGGKAGDWVEIDLGRDRTIGQIGLVAGAKDFWPQFDVLVYGTGQKLEDATPWAKEINWRWAAANRGQPVAGDSVLVNYCAPAIRIRFIRIINRSSEVGKLKAIRVEPLKVVQ